MYVQNKKQLTKISGHFVFFYKNRKPINFIDMAVAYMYLAVQSAYDYK